MKINEQKDALFVESVSLHTVLQWHVNYQVPPIAKLIQAIVSHGIAVSQNNNVAEGYVYLSNMKIPESFSLEIPLDTKIKFINNAFKIGASNSIKFTPLSESQEQELPELTKRYNKLTPELKTHYAEQFKLKRDQAIEELMG